MTLPRDTRSPSPSSPRTGPLLLLAGFVLFAAGLVLYHLAAGAIPADPEAARQALRTLQGAVRKAGYAMMIVGFLCVVCYRIALVAARRRRRGSD